MAEQATGLTLSRLALLARRAWPVILLSTFIGAGSAYVVSEREIPLYESSASVYFSIRQGGSGSELNQGSAYTQAQILSFATLATSSITLNEVINDLGLDITSKDLARNITVTIPQNTVVLNISVSSRDAQRAADIANSVATNLSTVVVELAPAAEDDAAAVSARVIEPAVRAAVQSSPSASRDTALGAILGFLIGAVGCVLFALLDTRVRSAEVVSEVTKVPLLGQVGRFMKSMDARPVLMRDPNSLDAEAFRRVRAALPFTSVDQEFRAVLVTSGSPNEGKTTLAVNLALAIAESGARVLLMDADLRRPRVADALGVEGTVGLTTILVGAVEQDDAIRQYGSTNLDLLLSGTIPPNPAELLSSMAMAQLIADFASQYDMVIVDTAPVLSVADASLLSQHVDLTLLVVDASKTRKAQLARTVSALEIAGAYVSGIVLNRAKATKKRDVYHYGSPSSGSAYKRGRLSRLNPFRRSDTSNGWITAAPGVPEPTFGDRSRAPISEITPFGTVADDRAITPAQRPFEKQTDPESFTEAVETPIPDSLEARSIGDADSSPDEQKPERREAIDAVVAHEETATDSDSLHDIHLDHTDKDELDTDEGGSDTANDGRDNKHDEPIELEETSFYESEISLTPPRAAPIPQERPAPALATPNEHTTRVKARRPFAGRPSVEAREQRQGESE